MNDNTKAQVREGKMNIMLDQPADARPHLPFSEADLLQDLNIYTAHADELASVFQSELEDNFTQPIT